MHEFLSNMADRRMKHAAFAVVILLAIFLAAQTLATLKGMGRSEGPATDVVTVSAEGQATLTPDVARVSFTVERTAPAVADAQAAATTQINDAIKFVKDQGIEDRDVRTLSYTISPQYAYPNPCSPGMVCPAYSSPKVTGYQVAQTIEVKVRDLTKVGDLLAGLGKLQVQNLSGPAFALDDPTAGYTAARADAIEKARAEAKQLAKQLGVRLGKIVNFNESSGGYPYPMMGYGMGGAMREDAVKSTPGVPAGENTYSVSVSITYEIR